MTLLKGMVHQVSSSAPGTGDVSLPSTSATGGRQTFLAAFGTGNSCYYYLENDSGSEWGEGTITGSSTATLTRDTVIGNSDGTTSKINFTGVVNAWSGIPAERALFLKQSGGTAGQILTLGSGGDNDAVWADPPTSALDWKQSVRVASTANIDLSSGPNAGDTLDGITLAEGDPFLAMTQDTASENGVYITPASGAPTRRSDFDEDVEVTAGATVFVAVGTANGGKFFVLTTSGTIVVGTTDLTFSQLSASPEWGSIGGTLSAQTDLQAALDAKADLARNRAKVGLSSAQSIPNASLTTISWATEDYDVGGLFDAGSPTRLTCSADGVVQLGLAAIWGSSGTGNRYIAIRKNGTDIIATDNRNAIASSDAIIWGPLLEVTSGDYFEVLVYQASGGALNFNAVPGTWFSMRYIE